MCNEKYNVDDNWDCIKDHDIFYLIRRTEDFIVFIDSELDIDWETTKLYDAKDIGNKFEYNSIFNAAARLESIPCDWMSKDMKIDYKRLIGEALVCNFQNDYVNAEKILETAQNYITARNKEQSRLWYLSSSFIATIPFLITILILWIFRIEIQKNLGNQFFCVLMGSCTGSMGALISIGWRSGSMELDSSAGKLLHCVEGISRILTGAFSGIIVVLAIKTEMILAPLSHGKSSMAVIMLVSLAAGAGERLAKSVISSIDKKEDNVSKNKKIKLSIDNKKGKLK